MPGQCCKCCGAMEGFGYYRLYLFKRTGIRCTGAWCCHAATSVTRSYCFGPGRGKVAKPADRMGLETALRVKDQSGPSHGAVSAVTQCNKQCPGAAAHTSPSHRSARGSLS